jgi:cytoskeletal protein CcmA (bactofilin family)
MAIFNKDSASAATDNGRSTPLSASTSLSIIAAGTTIDGDIDTDGVIRIEGRVEGAVRAGRQVLIGRQGEVRGDVTTREAVIGGKVQGAVSASERLEVQDITTKAIAVIEGGKINGNVRITDARDAALDQTSSGPTVAVVR